MNPSIFYQHFLLLSWQKTIETDHLIVRMIICLCVDVGWMDSINKPTSPPPPNLWYFKGLRVEQSEEEPDWQDFRWLQQNLVTID